MKKLITTLLVALLSLSVFAACDRPVSTEVKDGAEQLTSAVTANAEKKTTTATEANTEEVVTTAKTTKAAPATVGVPSVKQLTDGYFKVVAGIEKGTSGASLKTARGAVAAFQFAQTYNLRKCNIDTLRDAMLKAYESLSDEKRADFDESFMDVVYLLDEAKDDYSAVAGTLEDAGVKDTFDKLVKGAGAWDNWDTLKAHTLTLGNSES